MSQTDRFKNVEGIYFGFKSLKVLILQNKFFKKPSIVFLSSHIRGFCPPPARKSIAGCAIL